MTARWVNWAGDQVCAPAAIERPGSEAELVDVVAAAARNGARVRAVGTGHSFTDCACTDGVLVDMTGLQRIVDVDPTNGLATVEGGAELHALLAQLADRGFGLENQGDIDKQSITGATATATHGTGARFRNVSAQIVAARLVTAQGRVLEISESSDSDAYLAARVSLGALGVISQVTVKVVPLFTLHRRDELRPLDKTLHHLDEYVDGNDHFEFFVFPYGDTALTRSTRRSHEQPRPQPRWKKRLGEELENAGLDAVCRAGRRFPGAAPQLNRLLTNLLSPSTVQDHGWKVYASARKVKFTEMEYAIPREHAAAAVPRVIELVRRRKLPIMFPLEVRFSAPTRRTCRPRTAATPATSRCISSPGWSSKATSAPSRKSWMSMRDGHIGANGTTRAPPRCAVGTRNGTASPPSATDSTPTGSSSTTTRGACWAPDPSRPRTRIAGTKVPG